METYTKEKVCVQAAQIQYFNTNKAQLVFKKGRKYIFIEGELRQKSKNTFKNAFGETIYDLERSDILKEYENNGWELRGWINYNGCFKNN